MMVHRQYASTEGDSRAFGVKVGPTPGFCVESLVCDCNRRLHSSGSTVVTMTSKVNGEMEILNPCRSETDKT